MPRREGAWGLTLKAEYFRAIKEAGFDSVRLPVKWSAHSADTPPYAIDAKFFERIDWALDQAEKNKLNLVLNIHHFDGMDADPDKFEPKFLALWKQIAERYQGRPDVGLFRAAERAARQAYRRALEPRDRSRC